MMRRAFPIAAPALAAVMLCAVASASRAQSSDEKAWLLQEGRGISADQLHGPSLTLQDQQLSGTTGCNAFTATLSEAGQRVKIENLSLTRKLCAPRRNEAERAFVRALGETAFLQKEPERLTFLSGTREPLLVWKKAATQGAPATPQGAAPPSARNLSIRPAVAQVRERAERHVKQRRRTRHVHRRMASLGGQRHGHRHGHGFRHRQYQMFLFPRCADLW